MHRGLLDQVVERGSNRAKLVRPPGRMESLQDLARRERAFGSPQHCDDRIGAGCGREVPVCIAATQRLELGLKATQPGSASSELGALLRQLTLYLGDPLSEIHGLTVEQTKDSPGLCFTARGRKKPSRRWAPVT